MISALLLASLFVAACSRHDGSIAIVTAVPDFSSYTSSHEKKRAFVDFLTPIIIDENKKIAKDRVFLLGMHKKYQAQISLSMGQKKRLSQLAATYRVDTPAEDPLFWSTLLLRVDGIPPSLAITQAAIESAWGTSRFAVEGNNLFGHWCFSKGCGIVPNKRQSHKSHEVAKFKTVNKAVEKYLLNLNQLNAYKQLRIIRAQLRTGQQPITGYALSAGLENYSELGAQYINKVRKIINFKLIQPLDQLSSPIQP